MQQKETAIVTRVIGLHLHIYIYIYIYKFRDRYTFCIKRGRNNFAFSLSLYQSSRVANGFGYRLNKGEIEEN
jgi:hypothetical protein